MALRSSMTRFTVSWVAMISSAWAAVVAPWVMNGWSVSQARAASSSGGSSRSVTTVSARAPMR